MTLSKESFMNQSEHGQSLATEESQHEKASAIISNPFLASAYVFFKPKLVFDALFIRENWSWVPFFMVFILAVLPGFLFFQNVDFAHWLEIFKEVNLSGLSPAEINNLTAVMSAPQMQATAIMQNLVGLLVICLVLGAYYNFISRDDEKCIQGFGDWFGAMWWCSMPLIIAYILSSIIIFVDGSNSTLRDAVMSPLSVSFIFGLAPDSSAYEFLKLISINTIWSVTLGAILLKSWTEFTTQKAFLLAFAPFVFVYGLYIGFALL